MKNGSIAVIVNRNVEWYKDYEIYIKPYLNHFGFPYYEIENGIVDKCALVLIGHKGATLSDSAICAIDNGAGLVTFDADALPDDMYEEASHIKVNNIVVLNSEHYITKLHNEREKMNLYDSMELDDKQLKNGQTLLMADNSPFVQVSYSIVLLK